MADPLALRILDRPDAIASFAMRLGLREDEGFLPVLLTQYKRTFSTPSPADDVLTSAHLTIDFERDEFRLVLYAYGEGRDEITRAMRRLADSLFSRSNDRLPIPVCRMLESGNGGAWLDDGLSISVEDDPGVSIQLQLSRHLNAREKQDWLDTGPIADALRAIEARNSDVERRCRSQLSARNQPFAAKPWRLVLMTRLENGTLSGVFVIDAETSLYWQLSDNTQPKITIHHLREQGSGVSVYEVEEI